MKILVTGASGHIGGAVARLSRGEGHVVRTLVRDPGRAPAGSEAIPIDLAQATPDALARAVDGCDAVVHAAAWMGDEGHAETALAVNITGTLRLLEAAAGRAQTFVLVSGLNFLRAPLTGTISETYPVSVPSDLYALGKLAAEGLAAWFVRTSSDFRVVVLRPSSPVGPGLRRRRIFSLFCDAAVAGAPLRIHGSGSRVQDYVDARDIARAVLAALEHPGATGVFHVGSGVAVSNLELARRCVAVLDSPSEIRFSGLPDPEEGPEWVLDIRRAARELGWKPMIPLEDSIRDYVTWRRAAEGLAGGPLS
ncbi:MAG TPA: NAD(P)-dependent oxidoreductase [Candidatus Hydrogenedentes bacterium]|nr:NAD(P)-dependent oxidoreductase [Candidatus Hydrogenedentota bacterium]